MSELKNKVVSELSAKLPLDPIDALISSYDPRARPVTSEDALTGNHGLFQYRLVLPNARRS